MTAMLSRSQGMLKVDTPYNQAFVSALKDAIPWQDRNWSDTFHRAWAVDPRYADTVCSLMAEHFGDFDDYTDTTPAEAARQQHQAAVENTVRALREMPRATFNVVAVTPAMIEVQPKSRLGKQHFNALREAAFDCGKNRMLASGVQDHREFGWFFELPSSVEVLRTLTERHHCLHLEVVEGEVVEEFDEEGVAHLEVDGEFRVGVLAGRIATDSTDRTMLFDGNRAFYVLDPERFVREILHAPAYEVAHRVFMPRAAAEHWKRRFAELQFGVKLPRTPDWTLRLDIFVEHFHLEEWIQDWFRHQVEAPVEITRFKEGNYPGWRYRQPDSSIDLTGKEPGREVLKRLGAERDEIDPQIHPYLLGPAGWTHEDVQRLYAERQRKIREAQEAYIAKQRENAENVARQRLEEHTKAELAEIGEEYGVHIARSWRKAEQINALLRSSEAVEDVAGITQMKETGEE
jgi:hypothetical protein